MIQSKLEKKYSNFKISRFCNQILMIAMILIITGCSTKSVKLEFKADPDTNNGQPLCILLRSVNTSQFLTEGYNDVAGIVYSTPVDPSIIDSYLILRNHMYIFIILMKLCLLFFFQNKKY